MGGEVGASVAAAWLRGKTKTPAGGQSAGGQERCDDWASLVQGHVVVGLSARGFPEGTQERIAEEVAFSSRVEIDVFSSFVLRRTLQINSIRSRG